MKVTTEDLRELLQEQALTKEEVLEKLSISERTFYRLISEISDISKTDDRAPKYFINNKEMLIMAGVNNIIEEITLNLAEVGEFDATKGFTTGKGIELTIKDIRIEKDNITLKLEDPKKNIMFSKLDYFYNSGLIQQLLFSLAIDTKGEVKLNKKLLCGKKLLATVEFKEYLNFAEYIERAVSSMVKKEYFYFVSSFQPLTTQIFHLKLSEAVEAELNKNIQVLKKYPFLKNKELTGLLNSKNNYKEEVKNLLIQQISNSNRTLLEIQSEADVVSQSITFLRDLIPEEARVNLVETILK